MWSDYGKAYFNGIKNRVVDTKHQGMDGGSKENKMTHFIAKKSGENAGSIVNLDECLQIATEDFVYGRGQKYSINFTPLFVSLEDIRWWYSSALERDEEYTRVMRALDL